jgi:hypothetical protein
MVSVTAWGELVASSPGKKKMVCRSLVVAGAGGTSQLAVSSPKEVLVV